MALYDVASFCVLYIGPVAGKLIVRTCEGCVFPEPTYYYSMENSQKGVRIHITWFQRSTASHIAMVCIICPVKHVK